MTFNGRTGMSLTWNDLGLVEKVSLNGEDLVNYSYLADGTKVSALDGDGDGLLYLGSLIYRKTGSNISLESAGFAGGRFVARETLPGVSSMVPMFHVTDHLGSVRAVVDGVSGEVVETNDYYPFGSRWNTTSSLTDQTNRFRYNSKEEQFKFGTPYIDYGARQYDPVIARWFAQDPLAEKYYGISPYAFCAGNPVKYLDPDGEKLYFASNVSEKFKQQFAATIQFMNSRGTSGDLARLEASEVIYYIAHAKDSRNHFNRATNTISWDPNTVIETSDNILISPATVLAHEAAHAVKYDQVLNSNDESMQKSYIESLNSNDNNEYKSKEEERVITGTEQTAARKHGEIRNDQVTRKKHKGARFVHLQNISKPEELSRQLFEHNNLL